jgi:hypothetical protein
MMPRHSRPVGYYVAVLGETVARLSSVAGSQKPSLDSELARLVQTAAQRSEEEESGGQAGAK